MQEDGVTSLLGLCVVNNVSRCTGRGSLVTIIQRQLMRSTYQKMYGQVRIAALHALEQLSNEDDVREIIIKQNGIAMLEDLSKSKDSMITSEVRNIIAAIITNFSRGTTQKGEAVAEPAPSWAAL